MRKLLDSGYGSLLIITAVLMGFCTGVLFTKTTIKTHHLSKDQKKMQDLIHFIENNYVDKVNTDSIVNQTINYMLSDLDPHSKYIPAKFVSTVDEKLQGEFVGVGISYTIINDTVVVQRVLNTSPNKAKLVGGDKILSADGHTLVGDSAYFVSKYLKGKQNTYVEVNLLRDKKKVTQKLIREKIQISPIRAAYMINDYIGFINLESFTANSADLFNQALDSLKSRGMKTLILDLRGNGGGFLSQATKIADDFLPNGKVIYYIKGRNHKKQETKATARGNFENGNLYVLIDEDTASASELLAGAIQDQDRGIIVGRRSFGKGLVQQEIPLSDGSKVRLTTARYYTPTGRSIQKPFNKGENGVKQYQDESYERYFSGELYFSDSIKTDNLLKFKTPKGKIVYGGGGIIPDAFVPADTLKSINYKYFHHKNTNIFNYVNSYIQRKRNVFKKLSFTTFNNKFNLEKYYNGYLKELGQKQNIPGRDKQKIQLWLKLLIARNFYGDQAYFQIKNLSDNYIKKVLNLEIKTAMK